MYTLGIHFLSQQLKTFHYCVRCYGPRLAELSARGPSGHFNFLERSAQYVIISASHDATCCGDRVRGDESDLPNASFSTPRPSASRSTPGTPVPVASPGPRPGARKAGTPCRVMELGTGTRTRTRTKEVSGPGVKPPLPVKLAERASNALEEPEQHRRKNVL